MSWNPQTDVIDAYQTRYHTSHNGIGAESGDHIICDRGGVILPKTSSDASVRVTNIGSDSVGVGAADPVAGGESNTVDPHSSVLYVTAGTSWHTMEGRPALQAVFDGAQFYVMEAAIGERIVQYNIPTPYDLRAWTVTETLAHPSTYPADEDAIRFNDTGDKFYIGSHIDNTVYEYSLSIPYSLNTASQVASKDFGIALGGISWDPTGTTLYVSNANTTNVSSYDCSIAFDVTTASHSSDASLGRHGIGWNDDGTRMYMGGGDSVNYDAVQFDLSTAYDITTASQSATIDPSSGGFIQDVGFTPDGSTLYVNSSGTGNGARNRVEVFECSTPFDISTASSLYKIKLGDDFAGSSVFNREPQYE